MLRHKRVRADHSLADVPHHTFAHLHSRSVGSRFQITLHPEVHSGRSLIDVRVVDPTDSALGEKDSNEGRIVPPGPILDREGQRIGVVLRWIGELQESVHRYAGVVEPEAEERQLEVEVLVHLGHRGVDVPLVVTDVFRTTLAVERVEEVASDLGQPGRGDGVGCAIFLEVGRILRLDRVVQICRGGVGEE